MAVELAAIEIAQFRSAFPLEQARPGDPDAHTFRRHPLDKLLLHDPNKPALDPARYARRKLGEPDLRATKLLHEASIVGIRRDDHNPTHAGVIPHELEHPRP